MNALTASSLDYADMFTSEQTFSRWRSIANVVNNNDALAEIMAEDDNLNGTDSNWVPDKVTLMIFIYWCICS